MEKWKHTVKMPNLLHLPESPWSPALCNFATLSSSFWLHTLLNPPCFLLLCFLLILLSAAPPSRVLSLSLIISIHPLSLSFSLFLLLQCGFMLHWSCRSFMVLLFPDFAKLLYLLHRSYGSLSFVFPSGILTSPSTHQMLYTTDFIRFVHKMMERRKHSLLSLSLNLSCQAEVMPLGLTHKTAVSIIIVFRIGFYFCWLFWPLQPKMLF